eukprot:c23690_g1_i1 orf=256-672(+)
MCVFNVYAPNNYVEREEMWGRLEKRLEDGKYVLMGDFNMVEQEEDRRGGLGSGMHGTEKEAWEKLKWKVGLVDKSMEDTRIMSWSNGRVVGRIEARLDRIYLSQGGNWMVGNLICNMDLGEVLSDHKPVSLEGRLLGE